jgi:hypothetical protein
VNATARDVRIQLALGPIRSADSATAGRQAHGAPGVPMHAGAATTAGPASSASERSADNLTAEHRVLVRYPRGMADSQTEPLFDAAPRILIEVPAAAMGDFPEADLGKLRPRNSRYIVGIFLGPPFGLFFGLICAMVGLKSALADHGLQETDNWFTVAAGSIALLMWIAGTINFYCGDWTMFASAAVTVPLLILGLHGTVLSAVLYAAALALCTMVAIRGHQVRGIRYRRISPIFTSHHRVDGTITDLSYRKIPRSRNVVPTLTIAAGGLLLTAEYQYPNRCLPAIGHPVAVWLCDQDPDIQVVCIDRAARNVMLDMFSNPMRPARR